MGLQRKLRLSVNGCKHAAGGLQGSGFHVDRLQEDHGQARQRGCTVAERPRLLNMRLGQSTTGWSHPHRLTHPSQPAATGQLFPLQCLISTFS